MIGKIKRNLQPKIESLLENFPVVALLGARQCGKTTLAKMARPKWNYFDLENPRDFDRIQYDPVLFFEQNPGKIILDEAQEHPELFKVLRGVVDQQRQEKNRFLITGSSSPELISQISETLAGRIAVVEVNPLKANEFYQKPLSTFYQLFLEKLNKDHFSEIKPELKLKQIQHLWLKGGYPEPLLMNDDQVYGQWMDNYRDTYLNRDISKLFPGLNHLAYRRFLTTLSKLSGTIINKQSLARSIEVSEGTIREYLTIAEGTYLWRNLPSFEKNIVKSIIKMPKGFLRDTGLLHYLLKIPDQEALLADPLVGHSFESFVIEEIVRGLQACAATNWESHYYRTRNGAEIDLILEGPFGTLPIQIKYGSYTPLKQLITLSRFVDEHQLPFGIVMNQSSEAIWLKSNIIQIPVTYI